MRVAVGSSGPTYPAYADAATDSSPPGLGGYCHGLYWYIPLRPEWLNWLHITLLELLATGINAIVFAAYWSNATSGYQIVRPPSAPPPRAHTRADPTVPLGHGQS